MEPTFIPPVANPQRAKVLSKKILVIVIGLVVMMILGVGLLFAMQSNSPTTGFNTLTAQMESLSAMLVLGAKSARNSDVLKASTDGSIIVSGDVASLSALSSTLGVKPDKQVSAAEKASHQKVMADLQKAAIDSRFDTAYVPEILKKLDSVSLQLKEVSATARPSSRAVIKNIDTHIDTITQSFKTITL